MIEHNYGPLARMMHAVAFGAPFVQTILADMEATLFKARWADQPVQQPIFVTALPRAGTTLLLDILHHHPDVATHTYRDMPFVRAPVLWHAVSKSFHRNEDAQERAHGDQMLIDPDSPEAFEEVLWLTAFSDHYRTDGIAPWTDAPAHFTDTLREHMRRIVRLRHGTVSARGRYASKNNANIARTSYLREHFPDAHIVVPVRDPLTHAQSMLDQHVRFSAIHGTDAFTKRYMRDIGHFEFGDLHRPILFDGMDDVRQRFAPEQIDYWIGYWLCAYRHLARQDDITFVPYERLVDEGRIDTLFAAIGLRADDDVVARAQAMLRPATTRPDLDQEVTGLIEARALYQRLCASAVV